LDLANHRGFLQKGGLGFPHYKSYSCMSHLNKPERTAIEAVARRFSATWEKGSDLCDTYLTVAGKRVAVDLATIKRRGTGEGAATPRLRFDKVATGLIERLQASLGQTVLAGITVLLTITWDVDGIRPAG
jgi:hypothetical protein